MMTDWGERYKRELELAVDKMRDTVRERDATIQQLEARVKELTVVAGRVLKLEEQIREVCGIELNVLSNMGISFVEKAVRWYQQRVKELVQRQPRELARHQPCGCIVCICGDVERCQGCGAKSCGTHEPGFIQSPVYRPLDSSPDSA